MRAEPELSIALLTHNETVEFSWLVDVLEPILGPNSELVILDDYSGPEMLALVRAYATRFAQRSLNRNFAAQRNHLKSLCRGRYIFALDPDELPDPGLLEALPRILEIMERDSLDLVEVPRLGAAIPADGPVDARTLTFTDEELRACMPNYQSRIFRNVPEVRYVNRVHERLVGPRRIGRLPMTLRYALYHVMAEARRIEHYHFYRSIRMRYVDKWRKSLAKRLRLMPRPEVVPVTIQDLERATLADA